MSADMSQWIWDTMVSMTLLMAIVLLLRKPVRHYFGAKVAYLLWALPIARLFMPVLTLEAPATVPVEPLAATPAALTAIGELAMSTPAQAGSASIGALASIDWLMIALILWIGGAGMLFISKLASYVQFREDIIADGQLVGRHGNIKILETAAVGGPLAFGVFQKYIAVPTNFFRNYAPRERELALEHEITHHESGDLAANFVGLMILSLHWFNPIAWFAWVAFREDQETACDARILQKSGHEVRAVYGRTIAKSMSGHQLGLASPLNQKDKIKGRLKMLGQGEKSGFRKKLGAIMVGSSAVIALPLTATISYAEAAHPMDTVDQMQVHKASTSVDVGDKGVVVTETTRDGYKYTITNKAGVFEFVSKRKLNKREIDKKLSKAVPSFKNMNLPEEPEAPALPERPVVGDTDQVVNITMLNGSKDFENDEQFVHKIRHDGRTIILRTNKKLSKSEVREMVQEAEQSRIEADQDLREAEADLREHKREMRQHEREVRMEMREVEREIEEAMRESQEAVRESVTAVREAKREAREAAAEAKAEARSTRRLTSNVWSIANQVAEISFAPQAPRAPRAASAPHPAAAPALTRAAQPDCKAMNKQIAFGGRDDELSKAAWAVVAGCGNFEVKIDQKKLLKMTLKSLKKQRAKEANCENKDKGHKDKLRAFDRDIKKLKSRLSMT